MIPVPRPNHLVEVPQREKEYTVLLDFSVAWWCISAVFPVTCHGVSWWQSSVAAALFTESSQWLVSLLTWFARDWKTVFIPWFQWAVAKAPLSGSLAYKSHSWETDNLIGVFGVKVISQQSLGVWFPFLSCLWEARLSFQVYCVGRLILTQYLGWWLVLMDIIGQLSKVPLSKSYMSWGLCDRQKLLRDQPDCRISHPHIIKKLTHIVKTRPNLPPVTEPRKAMYLKATEKEGRRRFWHSVALCTTKAFLGSIVRVFLFKYSA